jgi:hypothetical protein
MTTRTGQDSRHAIDVGENTGARKSGRPASLEARRSPRAYVGVMAPILVWLAGFSVAAPSGCFDPKILPGSFHCGPLPENRCPDGFKCVNGLCGNGTGSKGGSSGASGAGGAGGMGGAGGTCAHPVPSMCPPGASVPATGITAVCDPVCQTGCGCGLRCSLTATGPACVPATGTNGLGQLCDPAADNCKPGYTGVKERCGTQLGRCYLLCRDASVCGTGNGCGIQVSLPGGGGSSGFRVCNAAAQSPACDPYALTGCPDPALVCYATNEETTCECPSGQELQVGATCIFSDNCAAGLTCRNIAGASTCHKVCKSDGDCAGGVACAPSGASGYCP